MTGLRLGADDYLVTPFSPRELAARVEACCAVPAGACWTAAKYLIRPDGHIGVGYRAAGTDLDGLRHHLAHWLLRPHHIQPDQPTRRLHTGCPTPTATRPPF